VTYLLAVFLLCMAVMHTVPLLAPPHPCRHCQAPRFAPNELPGFHCYCVISAVVLLLAAARLAAMGGR
jgi:hypothetical protein